MARQTPGWSADRFAHVGQQDALAHADAMRDRRG
jgi:hypothetical protein